MDVKDSTVKVRSVMVAAVRAVRILRLRRLETPSDRATAVALNRPMSASCMPVCARLIFWTSWLNLDMTMMSTVVPSAKMTKARKIT